MLCTALRGAAGLPQVNSGGGGSAIVCSRHTLGAAPLTLQPKRLYFLFLFFVLLFSLLHIGFKQKHWILPFSQAITSNIYASTWEFLEKRCVHYATEIVPWKVKNAIGIFELTLIFILYNFPSYQWLFSPQSRLSLSLSPVSGYSPISLTIFDSIFSWLRSPHMWHLS